MERSPPLKEEQGTTELVSTVLPLFLLFGRSSSAPLSQTLRSVLETTTGALFFFSLLLTNPDVSGLRFSKLGHFGFEEKTEEAGFPSRTRRPVPQISQIKAFSSRHPSRSVTGPGARTLLVLTPAPAFSPPPQKRARRRGPLRRAAPKDEERASGSRLYLLERENKRGSDGFFFFKREKKQE